MNGTEETAEWLFEAWALEKVGSVPEVVAPFAGIPDYSRISEVLPNASEYFAFADCMIWSHVFAVRVAPAAATEVVWLCGTTYAVVAPTFGAFWELYLSNPDAVLFASKSGHKSGLQ
jgi:hypothetical protein